MTTTETAEENVKRANDHADALADPTKFKFIDFIRAGGSSLPTEEIIVFTDLATSMRITTLKTARLEIERLAKDKAHQQYIAALNDSTPAQRDITYQIPEEDNFQPEYPADYYEYQNEITKLNEKLWDSRIVLTMKGIAPHWLATINETMARFRNGLKQSELTDEEVDRQWMLRRTYELVRHSLVAYSIPSQEITSSEKMSNDEIKDLLAALYISEEQKVIDAATVLTYAAVIADPRTDAGFLSGRDVPTGEPRVPDEGQDGTQLAPTAE